MADVRILYYGWARDRVGVDQETMSIGHELTLEALMEKLRAVDPAHDRAFADLDRLRAAINDTLAPWTATVRPGDEVALFPPVTGG